MQHFSSLPEVVWARHTSHGGPGLRLSSVPSQSVLEPPSATASPGHKVLACFPPVPEEREQEVAVLVVLVGWGPLALTQVSQVFIFRSKPGPQSQNGSEVPHQGEQDSGGPLPHPHSPVPRLGHPDTALTSLPGCASLPSIPTFSTPSTARTSGTSGHRTGL